jgi:hypothetical protein
MVATPARWLPAGVLLPIIILTHATYSFPNGLAEGATPLNGELQLHTSFSLDSEHLVLDYEVKNAGVNDAYLLNRVFQSAPEWKMSPDLIYIRFDRSSETILLSKKIPDLPAGIRVTSPVAPFVTPLRRGSSFKERVQILLPVKEFWPYPVAPSGGPAERKLGTYKFVRLKIGYYWKPEGTKEEVRDISGTEVVIPHTPPGKQLSFGTLESPQTRLDVPVEEVPRPAATHG